MSDEQPQYRPDIQASLPQSELGGLHPELRARITAAKAALGDYQAEDAAYIRSSVAPKPAYTAWADRLAAELRSLLEIIERHQP